jgi:hypothetical protein
MKSFVVFLVCCSLLHICSGLIFAAQENPMLESISFAPGEGETENITFKLKGGELPKIFAIKGDNPRLVFDFHNTSYNGQSKISVSGSKLVESIRSAVHREPKLKTRVVVDLTTAREVSYKEDFLDHTSILKINLAPVGKAKTVDKPELQASTQISKEAAEVEPKPETGAAPTPQSQPETDGSAQSVPAAEKKVVKNVPAQGTPLKASEPATAQPLDAVKHDQAPQPEKTETVTENEAKQTAPADSAKTASVAVEPVLLDVSFDGSSDKGELVQFKLNDFFAPTVSAIEEGAPRVLCDFAGMKMDPNVRALIPAGGKYVDTIRVVQHHDPEKIRIVLDLQPNHSYDLQQVFFKEENTFVLIVNVLKQEKQAGGQ